MMTTEYILFRAKYYSIRKPTDWLVQKKDEHRTAFIGPKVGPFHVGFFITILENYEGDYISAAKEARTLQAQQAKHHIIEEQDVSKGKFDAMMRYSTWYNRAENIMMYTREIYTERNKKIYVLSSSVPNSPDLQAFDNIFIEMLNSFKYNKLPISNK